MAYHFMVQRVPMGSRFYVECRSKKYKLNSPTMSICVIGDAFLDILTIVGPSMSNFQEEGDTLAESISLMAGGSGLNTSFRLKEIDSSINITFLSSVGHDEQGEMLERSLKDMGVHTCLLKDDQGGQTGACVVLSVNTKRSFITQRGVIDEFQVRKFSPETLRDKAITASHLHCAGYFNCSGLRLTRKEMGELDNLGQVQDLVDLFRSTRECSGTTSINPQDDASGSWKLPMELLEYTTFLIGNEEEITNIARVNGNDSELPSHRGEVAKILLSLGCHCVVITRGRDGAEAYLEGTDGIVVISQRSVPLEQTKFEVVDTTGAGDSFVAGFLHVVFVEKYKPDSHVQEQEREVIRKAMRMACLMGAHATLVRGGSTVDRGLLNRFRQVAEAVL